MKRVLSGLAALFLLCSALGATETVIWQQVNGWPTQNTPIVLDHQAVPTSYELKTPRLDPVMSQALRSIKFRWTNSAGYWNGIVGWENHQDQPWGSHGYALGGGMVLSARPLPGSLQSLFFLTGGQLQSVFGGGSYMSMWWANPAGLTDFDGSSDFSGSSGTGAGYGGGYNEVHEFSYYLGTSPGWARRWACTDADGAGNAVLFAKAFGFASIGFSGEPPSHWTDTPATWDRMAEFYASNDTLYIGFGLGEP